MSGLDPRLAQATRTASTITSIIDTLAVRIVTHPLVVVPRIFLPDGRPIAITKVRVYSDGIDPANTTGVTMTVVPFSFTDNVNPKLTASSHNATYNPKVATMGRGERLGHNDSYDLVSLYILVKFTLAKVDLTRVQRSDLPSVEGIVFEYNPLERVIIDYADLVCGIINDHLRKLRSLDGAVDLVESLEAQWINCPTSNWQKDANLLMHESHLLVCATYKRSTALVGDKGGFLSSLSGPCGYIPDSLIAGGKLYIGYDWAQNFYYRMDTNTPLTTEQITDPSTGQIYSTINTSVVQINVGGKSLVREIVTMEPTNT